VVSPEKILSDSRFQKLWANKYFMDLLFSISIDEAHCITEWGEDFRPEYSCLGRLRYQMPSDVYKPYHIVSATLPPHILRRIINSLLMRDDHVIIRRLNDRSNVHPIIERMQYPANGWLDIDRILKLHTFMPEPSNEGEAPRLPPFLVYVNSHKDSELLCMHEWNALPDHYLKDKIVWFHSGMSS
jgi:superfamily II DNA helicase RecQ